MYHLIFIVKIKNIMKVCILGNGLVSLTLAKSLNLGINVDIFSDQKIKNIITANNWNLKNNIEFFNSNILILKNYYGIK